MEDIYWGELELEAEVTEWFNSLDDVDKVRVGFHFDRLATLGPLLDQPHTKQLRGKLRELRFQLGGRRVRVSYWIAPGRVIVLLTVFVKKHGVEFLEVQRALRAFERCKSEHIGEEGQHE
ncbi:MAG: type II toxin-antitoxin system RelE/ParE family toxin [Actinomycetota bacterium]